MTGSVRYRLDVLRALLFRSLRRLRLDIGFSLAVFLTGIAAGAVVAGASATGSDGTSYAVSTTFTSLLLNNVAVYLLMILGSVTFGLTSLFLLFNTGLLVGTVTSSGLANGSEPIDVVLLIGTHGVLELPAFLFAAAIGFGVTRDVIQYLRGKQDHAVDDGEFREYAVLAVFGLVLIVVAAYIEANVTRQVYELVR